MNQDISIMIFLLVLDKTNQWGASDVVRYKLQSSMYIMFGFYTPIAWRIGSFGVIVFQILDAYNNQEDEKEFQKIAIDFCNSKKWGDQLYLKNHICELSYQAYPELTNKEV